MARTPGDPTCTRHTWRSIGSRDANAASARCWHAGGHAGTPEVRSRRIGRAIAKRYGQQVVEVTTLRWHGRLTAFEQVFEQMLFRDGIHQRHRRDDVLGFDREPLGRAQHRFPKQVRHYLATAPVTLN